MVNNLLKATWQVDNEGRAVLTVGGAKDIAVDSNKRPMQTIILSWKKMWHLIFKLL